MKIVTQSYYGTVLSVNREQGTVNLDIGTVDKDGNPVYMVDVPFDGTLSDPKVGDRVSALVEKMVAA